MGQVSARFLAALVGWGLCGAGAVSVAELFKASKTSLPPETALAWSLGPTELLVGIALLLLRSRFTTRPIINGRPLGLTGAALIAVPIVVAVLGASVAKNDSIRISTNTAMLTLLLGVPGLGMLAGGFRIMMYDRRHGPPVRVEPKPRIKKRK